jgi:CheY-like chemotaxis protein
MKNLKILLVEDHLDTASMLRILFTRDGYNVAVVGSCADAIIRAQHVRFDLLICDLGLPDGDGCALLKTLRQIYPIPAMAMTGFAFPGDKERALNAGFDFFIPKPCDFKEVAKCLASVADQKALVSRPDLVLADHA